MKKLILALALLLFPGVAFAVPATCTVSGIVYGGGGLPAPNVVVVFNVPQQIIGGDTIGPSVFSTKTDAAGSMTPISLVQSAVVQITVGNGFPVTGIVPLATTANFSQVLAGSVFSGGTFQVNGVNTTSQAAISWNSGTNITVSNPSAGNVKYDLTGTVPVSLGGSGRATLTAHSVLVGADTSGIAQVGPGTAGYCFVGNGASSDPSFQECPGPATSGTVTSVALALPNIFTVSGSPIATNGTLTGALATQTANRVFSGPTTGSPATPTFRALVEADIPTLDASKITGGILSLVRGGTGTAAIAQYNVVLSTGTSLAALGSTGTAGQVLTSNGASNYPAWQTFAGVTNVALSLPGDVFALSGTPVTSTGTLTGVFQNQTNNLIFAAPDGSTGVPTFRQFAIGDLSFAGGQSGTFTFPPPTCEQTTTTQLVFTNGLLTGHTNTTGDACPGGPGE